MWRDTPPAAATLIGLIGANALILLLWRGFPPAWRILNRYFISVPLYPYSLSMVGSVFSHQQLRHVATNMFILWFMGTRREFRTTLFLRIIYNCVKNHCYQYGLIANALSILYSSWGNWPWGFPCPISNQRCSRVLYFTRCSCPRWKHYSNLIGSQWRYSRYRSGLVHVTCEVSFH